MTGPGEARLRQAVRRFREDPPHCALRIELWETLNEACTVEEIRSLCFLLGISYDAFLAETKAGKARELVAHYDRREALDDVVRALRQLRPDLDL